MQLERLEKDKDNCISLADSEEKLYQKYLKDLEEWKEKKDNIVGDSSTEGTLKYYENEDIFIRDELDSEYEKCVKDRDELLAD